MTKIEEIKDRTFPTMINTHTLIEKWMTKEPVTLTPEQTIGHAVDIISYYNFYSIPVVDNDARLEGMITKSNIMDALFQKKTATTPIKEVMEIEFGTVSPLDSINKATNMQEGCLPVITENRKLVGIITRTDVLKAISKQFTTVETSLSNMNILQQVLNSIYEGIVVVDTRGKIIEINEAYCRIIQKKRKDVLNKQVENVIEHTQLHKICRTGKTERNKIQRINGKDMIVHRIALMEKNKVIAAVGMLVYQNIGEMYQILDNLAPRDKQLTNLKGQLTSEEYYLNQIIGKSTATEHLKLQLFKIAKLPSTVLITGDTGTGKGLCAKTIHELSHFSNGNFVSVNCSAIPENLLESELFGYEPGAFTDANRMGKKGKFELANNGTIFLDEIGDMPLMMQAKLLKVIQEKTIEPIGSTNSKKINIRIIAATNQNLKELIDQKKFREDLYYRLHVLPVQLTSLASRPEDITPLLHHFLKKFSNDFQCSEKTLTPSALTTLTTYSWPGNTRELINVCERLVGLSEQKKLTISDLPPEIIQATVNRQKKTTATLADATANAEKQKIIQALINCGGNKTKTAKQLQISRASLYQKIEKYELNDL